MGMDVYGRKPVAEAGKYFRANIWSWQPIHALCETVLARKLLSWAFNDGDGFKSQQECDDLADRLEKYLEAFPSERIEIESAIRVNEKGLLMPGITGGRTAFSARREQVCKFIAFLRACGGFEIR